MRLSMRTGWALLALPCLAACINDAASWQIEGKEHALTLFRDQRWFWNDTLELAVVVARLPECQRRHFLAPARAGQATVEVYQTGGNDFLLKQGARYYQIESRSCAGFQKLDAEPVGGVGVKMGSFREKDGKLRFIPESKG